MKNVPWVPAVFGGKKPRMPPPTLAAQSHTSYRQLHQAQLRLVQGMHNTEQDQVTIASTTLPDAGQVELWVSICAGAL